jgi:glycerol-3-phosphate acyltransferase PlsY
MLWIEQIFGTSLPSSHLIVVCLGGYMLGCFSTGYYLIRFRLGQDIRELGSGNAGARNVGRFLGAPGFMLTLFVDFAKGACAVWLTRHLTRDDHLAAFAMLTVVMGHIWPLQLGFGGGKGIATSLGALVFYDLPLALAFAGFFAGIYCILRRGTLSGLLAFAMIPLAAIFLGREAWQVIILLFLAGLVLLAHRKNVAEEVANLVARRSTQAKPKQSFK